TTVMGGVNLMLVTTAVTTIVWIVVTYATAPTDAQTLDAFYRRVRPGGAGWRPVAERLGFHGDRIAGGALSWVNWVAGVVSVYASLFGLGRLIFGPRFSSIPYFVVAVVAFAIISRNLRAETNRTDHQER